MFSFFLQNPPTVTVISFFFASLVLPNSTILNRYKSIHLHYISLDSFISCLQVLPYVWLSLHCCHNNNNFSKLEHHAITSLPNTVAGNVYSNFHDLLAIIPTHIHCLKLVPDLAQLQPQAFTTPCDSSVLQSMATCVKKIMIIIITTTIIFIVGFVVLFLLHYRRYQRVVSIPILVIVIVNFLEVICALLAGKLIHSHHYMMRGACMNW